MIEKSMKYTKYIVIKYLHWDNQMHAQQHTFNLYKSPLKFIKSK